MANALTAMMAAGQPQADPSMNRVSALVPQAPQANPAEQDYFQRILNQYPQLVEEYSAHPESKSGRVINTDVAREMSQHYREDRTRSADIHEPSSHFMKKLYADKLSQPTPKGMDNTVVFSAGGTGAGKTTALDILEKIDPALAKAEMIYDTNMNKFDSADKKIKQALEAKRKVRLIYTYRDPADALEHGALARAHRMERDKGSGRTVPIGEHMKTHLGAREVIEQLQKKYAKNPRVNIQIVDNSLGRGNARASQLDKIPKLEENETKRRLYETLERVRSQGIGGKDRISDAIYRGTKGSDSR